MEKELKDCESMESEGICKSKCSNDLLKELAGNVCCQACMYLPVCNESCEDWDSEEDDDDYWDDDYDWEDDDDDLDWDDEEDED